jgi:hypothetical protein
VAECGETPKGIYEKNARQSLRGDGRAAVLMGMTPQNNGLQAQGGAAVSLAIMYELLSQGFTRRVASALAYGQVISSPSELYSLPWSGASGGLRERLQALPGFGRKSLREVERLRQRHRAGGPDVQIDAGPKGEMRP